MKDPKDGHSDTYYVDGPITAMSQDSWRADGIPAWTGRTIEKNHQKITRPLETSIASGHFTFSYGHLLKAAGHDSAFEDYYMQEELWMTYAYWKAGYKLYSPSEVILYHLYDRNYRPDVIAD